MRLDSSFHGRSKGIKLTNRRETGPTSVLDASVHLDAKFYLISTK